MSWKSLPWKTNIFEEKEKKGTESNCQRSNQNISERMWVNIILNAIL